MAGAVVAALVGVFLASGSHFYGTTWPPPILIDDNCSVTPAAIDNVTSEYSATTQLNDVVRLSFNR